MNATPGQLPRMKRVNQLVGKGGILPPSAIVMHLSHDQWEEFIETACLYRQIDGSKYVQVKRLGNAGDAGRDIEARLVSTLTKDQWDLYQAKHYNHRLTPGDAFGELAKFFTNLAAGVFPVPRHYFFCSPQNSGPDLHDLIANPAKLRDRFLGDWKKGVTGLKEWANKLTPQVETVVANFDFSRIQECLVRDLIKWHENDQAAHFKLFGIEPERGDDPLVPPVPAEDELIYIEELLRIYAEDCKTSITLDEASVSSTYSEHLSAARGAFYCAEGLKRFSRDLHTEDEFGRLLDMVLNGIRPTVSSPKYKTGFDRLDRALDAASTMNVADSKLAPRIRGGDLPGACHHLANEGKIRWVP